MVLFMALHLQAIHGSNYACVMAASVVSNMLSNSFVFGDWPHYGGTCTLL